MLTYPKKETLESHAGVCWRMLTYAGVCVQVALPALPTKEALDSKLQCQASNKSGSCSNPASVSRVPKLPLLTLSEESEGSMPAQCGPPTDIFISSTLEQGGVPRSQGGEEHAEHTRVLALCGNGGIHTALQAAAYGNNAANATAATAYSSYPLDPSYPASPTRPERTFSRGLSSPEKQYSDPVWHIVL